MRRGIWLAAAVVGILAVVVTAGASAATTYPPTLLTYGNIEGHPYATWSLSSGAGPGWPPGCFDSLEVSTDPTVDTSGKFLPENVVASYAPPNSSACDTTQWTDSSPLPAGTYYVHVSNWVELCTYYDPPVCTPLYWSTVGKIVINPPSVAVPNVVGERLATAKATLAQAALKVAVKKRASTARKKGRVLSTKPAAGTKVPQDTRVTLVVGKG